MKNAYYTFVTWSEDGVAAGFGDGLDSGRRAAIVRQPVQKAREPDGDKVIDLAAWRPAGQELWDERPEFEPEYSLEETAEEPPARRARRNRRAYLDPELLATLSVIGVLAALMVRILVF
ncbi:MAG: hypothetical protein HDT38_07235 [Clostridiales bacterium]|nr:hypothetical protein [Clostridiales bacterium]